MDARADRFPFRLFAARRSRLAAMSISLGLIAGCAFINEENRPLLGAMDRGVEPATPMGQVMLTPVMVPAGLFAGALDAAVVYPATQFAPSVAQVNRGYFHKPEESTVKKSLLFVPRHFVALPDFLLLWTIRSWFDFRSTTPEAPPVLDLRTKTPGLEIRVVPDFGQPTRSPRAPAARPATAPSAAEPLPSPTAEPAARLRGRVRPVLPREGTP